MGRDRLVYNLLPKYDLAILVLIHTRSLLVLPITTLLLRRSPTIAIPRIPQLQFIKQYVGQRRN